MLQKMKKMKVMYKYLNTMLCKYLCKYVNERSLVFIMEKLEK